MTDLWDMAGEEHDALARQAALAQADAELEAVLPFLLASRTPGEYAHRSALAQDSIASIAARCGLDEAELMATARRRFDLYRQAIQEGQNILDETTEETRGEGSGPEKPDEHDTGPDFSHGYSEVPAGPPGGPDPRVTQVRPPVMAPVQQPAGARTAAADPESMMTPGYGGSAGPSSMPAGTGPGAGSGPAPDTTPAPDEATTQGLQNFNDTDITATSSQDPVRRRVAQVAASIRQSNPRLPGGECQRVARVVVGRYLQADLSGSVMGDGPVEDAAPQGSDGGGQGGGHMSGMAEYGLGRSLIRSAPEMLEALA